MLVALTLALAFQSVEVRIGAKQQADSVQRQAARDSARYVEMERMRDRNRRPVRRIPVTPELERTAFKDPAARTLLLRARAARLEQDSSLLSYDAHAYQRMSVGIGVKAVGRNRLLMRTENASRVRWSRANGVHIELKGERAVFPAVKDAESEVNMRDALPIPYYPGRDALWIGSGAGRVKAEVDENELIHPLATGAEAYYRYATGDSLTITLAPGNAIRLRELRIEPRRPEWKLSVGSFWFDVSSGQLVRAVYRMSVPMDIWGVVDDEMERDREAARARGGKPPTDDDVPPLVKGLMSPMKASLEAVTIEYGLYGGRFWLPRSQTAEGWAQASFMRIPFSMQEGFRYESVNGADSTPSTPTLMTRRELRDSLFGGDSTHWSDLAPEVRKERVAKLVHADSLRRARQVAQRETDCASTGFYTRVDSRDDGTLRTALRIPCDSTVLLTSPELPPSIYDAGEELFGAAARDELLKELDFSLQATWAPRPVRLAYGPTLWRYNRVEGLSAAASATQELGQGYSWDGAARLGTGDWSPNVTVGASRSNGRLVWRLGGYRRLAVANDDWGTPLSFGASLGSVLYARDEGYYFRATGVELTRSPARGGGFTTRMFVERQGAVETNVAFNVSRALGGGSAFLPNISAQRATTAGLAFRAQHAAGLDPAGWRAFADTRLEGGWTAMDSADARLSRAYGRVSAEGTLSRGLGDRFASSLTVGGGVSGNAPLPQRGFFLGGSETVRGQLLGASGGLTGGESYWLGKLELSRAQGAIRPVVFGDVGWAGARADWRHPGRPASGAGVGVSVLEGLLRLDLARGIYPRRGMLLHVYLDAPF